MSWIYLLLAFAVLLSIIFAAEDSTINIMLGTYAVVMSIEGLRVIIVAIRRKKMGAWIIGTGVIVFVFMMVMSVLINTLDLQLSGRLTLLMVFSGILGLPITMSIYLAKTVARTNFDLEKQLVTVKELSAKEIENEKKNADLKVTAEKEKAAAKEAELRARASEAQARAIQMENERKTKELEEARQLQLSLLPDTLPQIPDLEIEAYMKTATEVGGDYYDFHVDEKGVLTGVIGDATGHGLNAGTVVTATKSLFVSKMDEKEIVKMMASFNQSLKKMNLRFLFMCLLIFRIKKNKMELCTAGMPPAFVHRHKNDEVEEILLKGLPLGGSSDSQYDHREVKLNKNDTVLFMSDGFPELLNKDGVMFGYENVGDVFKKVADKSPREIINHFEAVGSDWTNGKDPDDDVTFIVIKIKK